MIKAGIFDIGGVLLNWNNKYLFEDIDETLQISQSQRHNAWKENMDLLEVGKISEKEFWDGFARDAKVRQDIPQNLLSRAFEQKSFINNDVLDIAREMRKNGFKTGILSNTNTPHARFLKSLQLFEYFDVVVLSQETGHRKPEPEIYHYTLKKLNIIPSEAFFVDDLPENVEAANEIGIHGLLFKEAEKLRSAIIGLGVEL
ncbi:MAG: HAD family phosphatase [Candidatus Levybacteria bacterium]|nr:HAD family phosphatase [Candidatus Levybacteria bacterium]